MKAEAICSCNIYAAQLEQHDFLKGKKLLEGYSHESMQEKGKEIGDLRACSKETFCRSLSLEGQKRPSTE